jgi:bacteriorhodopsin
MVSAPAAGPRISLRRWVVAALSIVAVAALVMSPPVNCSHDQKCAAMRIDLPRMYHACAMIGLTTLLLREVTQLVESVHEAMESEATIWSKKDRILPPFLMCMVLVSITTCDALYYFMGEPLAHVMPPGGGMVTDSRPVPTLRYIEWLFSVPVLLTLTGHCALGRPMKEVAWPIVTTNVYVVLAWIALVVADPWLRWFVVCACFIGYYFASIWMWEWVTDFLKATPEETPSRKLRASLVVLLVSLFAVYGVVYLMAIVDIIDAHYEKASYTALGFLAKVAMSCILTSIRASEHRQTLDQLLCRVGCLNTTMMSLLRGSFDVVLPCIATNSGGCSLSPFDTGGAELRELSIFMGRDMAGANINCILANPEEEERFAVYVRNSLRQMDGRLPFGSSRWSAERGDWVDLQCAQRPPLAQVLTVKMIRHSASGDSFTNVVVYIAPVPKSAGMFKDRELSQMLAAFRFEDCVPLPMVLAEDSLSQTLAKADPQKPAKKQAAQAVPTYDEAAAMPGQPHHLSHAAKVVMKKKMTKLLGKRMKDARKAAKDSKCSSSTSSTKSQSQDNDEQLSQSLCQYPDGEALLEEDQDTYGSETTRASFTSTTSTRVSYMGQDAVVADDVMSQSSKISRAGSVTMACRQLLGPLMDHLPMPQHMSRRMGMENYVQCAAQMVKMCGPSEITRLHHQQELAEWKEKCKARALADALKTGSAPDSSIDEGVWRTVLLPYLEAEAPGCMPVAPDVPDTEELWARAWKQTYEDSEDEEEE